MMDYVSCFSNSSYILSEYNDRYNNMILIAHRGNMNGPNPVEENKPEYLLKAIDKGYYVETDLWYVDYKLYLGHDEPQYEIKIEFLLSIKDKLFCHCKNIKALNYLIENQKDIECFYHNNDDCVLTSKNHIWTNIGKELTINSINVMPERMKVSKEQYQNECKLHKLYTDEDINKHLISNKHPTYYGICSDYV